METFDCQYNGENVSGFIRHSEANRCYMITFTYQNVDVSWDIDHPHQIKKIIFFICPIIDKYGEEGYKKLKKAYNTISSLNINYSLMNNAVYEHDKKHVNEEKTLEFRNALKELEEIGVKYDSFSETFI